MVDTQGHSLAILDDYEGAARHYADWSSLSSLPTTIFRHAIPQPDLADTLKPFTILHAMRERTKLDRPLLEQLPNLRLIATTGMRNRGIDLDAARDLGITVCGTEHATPTGGSSGAVEQTWALILALARRVLAEHDSVRRGGWISGMATGLQGKVLGLVGAGRLGKEVARVATAFGMRVRAWSPHLTPERAREAGVEFVDTLDELLETSDVVSLHLILASSTRGLLGARELALLKPSAFLVNTSRGPLIDEAALVDALQSGRLRGAGLDVYDVEPLPKEHPLRTLENVVLSPHMGASLALSLSFPSSRVLTDALHVQDTSTTRPGRRGGRSRSRTSSGSSPGRPCVCLISLSRSAGRNARNFAVELPVRLQGLAERRRLYREPDCRPARPLVLGSHLALACRLLHLSTRHSQSHTMLSRPLQRAPTRLARARTFSSSSVSRWTSPLPSLAGLPFDIAPEVAQARAEGRAIVALESTLVTHGASSPSPPHLPGTSTRSLTPSPAGLPPPHSQSLPKECEAILRAQGVTPATIAILDGRIKVGLDDKDLDLLAAKGWEARQDKRVAEGLWKVGRRELGAALVKVRSRSPASSPGARALADASSLSRSASTAGPPSRVRWRSHISRASRSSRRAASAACTAAQRRVRPPLSSLEEIQLGSAADASPPAQASTSRPTSSR